MVRLIYLFCTLAISVFGLVSCRYNDMEEVQYSNLENLTTYQPIDEFEPPYQLELNREVVFGDVDQVYLNHISNFTVDDSGRVFVADWAYSRGENAIYVFQSDGNFITTVGRHGRGPGEFSSIYDMQVQGEYLFVYDGPFRIHLFSLETLEVFHTIHLALDIFSTDSESRSLRPDRYFFVRDEDHFLLRFSERVIRDHEERYFRYHLFDQEGIPEPELLFKQREIQYIFPIQDPGPDTPLPFTMPYTRQPLLAVSDNGYMYTASSGEFLIKVYSSDGSYQRAFKYPYENSLLSREEAIQLGRSQAMRLVLQRQELPETWPALHSMFIDDENRLWVSTIIDSRDHYQWWVLDEQEQVVTTFKRSGKREVRSAVMRESMMVRNGYLYEYEEDEETGIKQIVRYRIELTER